MQTETEHGLQNFRSFTVNNGKAQWAYVHAHTPNCTTDRFFVMGVKKPGGCKINKLINES